MGKTVYVLEQRKDRSEWWVVVGAATLIVTYKYILVAGIVLVTTWLLYHGYQRLGNARVHNKVKYESDRRTKEARDLMDAPTQLITEGMRVWGNPEHYLDNYNDGMRDWR
jgi:hypothetical protein